MRMLTRLAAAAVVTASLAAPAMAVERGGTMVFARYADSLFLDPVFNDANVDIWVLTNLYDTLFQPTTDGKDIEPGLATGAEISDDGKTVTISLRAGIKFTDGNPITAEDVKWSLERARKPDNGIWGFTLESVDSIEAKGEDTVVLNLKNADPTIIAALATFNAAILPKAPYEAMPGATDQEKAEAFQNNSVGSGAFVLKEWVRGDHMVMERNPYYWKMGEDGKPLPYLDSVRFEVIPDDATRILKIKAGEVNGGELIPYSRVGELKNDPDVNMVLFPSTKVTYLTMNNRPQLADGSDNPLSDPRVRQALNYAVDKDAIVKVVTHGVGTPVKSFMSMTTPMAYGPAPAYQYDVAKAKALLAEAGRADGFEVTCLALAGSADDITILSAIQQMWSQVGVSLKIELVDNATRTARYRANDFQMRTSLWTNDIADPSQITSYFAYFPTIESLHTGFNNPRINELFEAAQKELDREKRTAMFKEVQEIYMDAAPLIFLYESPYPVALTPNLKGFFQIPLGNNIFAGAYLEK